jgi:hypothetical protein
MELAVRAALGSGFMGILALTLSESVLLSVLGGGAGVLLAVASMRVVRSTGTALSLPRLEDVGVDAPVLLFALGITVFCALFVSVLPLLRARRVSIVQVLRRAGTGPAGGRAPQRVRSALVVSQIALAVVLVTLSGLMTRSLLRLHDVRPGFEADHVVTSRVLLPFARYSNTGGARLNFFQAMVREAQAIPGARDVALTDWVPLSGDRHDMAIDVEDDPSQANAGGTEHAVAHVDGHYFQALRIPLFRGRTFGAQDAARPVDEAIVSHAFAERYWPGPAGPARVHLASAFARWVAAGTPSSARWATCAMTASRAAERDRVLSHRHRRAAGNPRVAAGGALFGRTHGCWRGRDVVGNSPDRSCAGSRHPDLRRGLAAAARARRVGTRSRARRAPRDRQRGDVVPRSRRFVRHHGVQRQHPPPRARHSHGARCSTG